MAYIKRYLEDKISESLNNQKILLIYGARQVGKTTLVKHLLDTQRSTYLNGDFLDDREKLRTMTRTMVEKFSDTQLLVIDEAQNIPDIGMKLKLLYDTLPNLKIIATGSSSFELSNKTSEPLTGRHIAYTMFPVALCERQETVLEEALVYGMYPDVVVQATINKKREVISHIAQSYLFKDVLNIEYIQNPKSLEYLLKALAAQIGNEVSAYELSNTLDMNAKTVEKYLDILEKLFIVFPLYPFTSKVRKSITKKRKYYFYDVGIRNAVLGDFSSIENRMDKGALWENFVIVERMKMNAYLNKNPQYYFFRTYKGEEIDLIEKYDADIFGFECKYSFRNIRGNIRKIYREDLQGKNEIEVIGMENYETFLLSK
jgi:predicted AAA+ superfamily ATPase